MTSKSDARRGEVPGEAELPGWEEVERAARSVLWWQCASCGEVGQHSELIPDPEHSCGRDECPRCHAVNIITCCYATEEDAGAGENSGSGGVVVGDALAALRPIFDRILAAAAEARMEADASQGVVEDCERDLDKAERERDEAAIRLRAADALADEVAALVVAGNLSSRSPAADALQDYREQPRSARSDALAEARAELAAALARGALAVKWLRELDADRRSCPCCGIDDDDCSPSCEIGSLLAAPAPPPGGLLALLAELAEQRREMATLNRAALTEAEHARTLAGVAAFGSIEDRLRAAIGLPAAETGGTA